MNKDQLVRAREWTQFKGGAKGSNGVNLPMMVVTVKLKVTIKRSQGTLAGQGYGDRNQDHQVGRWADQWFNVIGSHSMLEHTYSAPKNDPPSASDRLHHESHLRYPKLGSNVP